MRCPISVYAGRSAGVTRLIQLLLAAGLLVFGPIVAATSPDILTGRLEGLQGFLGGEEFYLRYRSASGEFYTGGNWASRINLQLDPEGRFAGPYIVPLEYHRRDP